MKKFSFLNFEKDKGILDELEFYVERQEQLENEKIKNDADDGSGDDDARYVMSQYKRIVAPNHREYFQPGSKNNIVCEQFS